MDKAKAAVSEFLHKSGHHDTTVHERVAPAVTQENISKTREERVQTAVDREVHQDHYHTSVQPVQHREILPEEHHHKIIGVEHKEHFHGDESAIKARLEQEAAQFRDTRTEGRTEVNQTAVPTVAGEHIHHHVHETIQPVIQKETIQPSIIHTTVPIHEVHHNEAKHHAASALPAVSMADFKKQGGVLSGREERVDGFEGEPRAVGNSLGGSGTTGTTGTTGTSGTASGYDNTTGGTSNGFSEGRSGGTGVGSGLDRRLESEKYDGTSNGGLRNTHDPVGNNYSGDSGYTDNTTGKKPSLLDRMNPMKDTSSNNIQ